MSLFFMFYILVAPTLAGSLIVAVLTVPNSPTNWLIWAAVLGFVAAAPIAWVLAKNIGGKKAS